MQHYYVNSEIQIIVISYIKGQILLCCFPWFCLAMARQEHRPPRTKTYTQGQCVTEIFHGTYILSTYLSKGAMLGRRAFLIKGVCHPVIKDGPGYACVCD